MLAKRASEQNLRKLSVSLGSLTPFSTSSTKIFLESIFLRGRKCVTIRHFKNSLRTKISQCLRHLIYLVQNMEYAVQAIKVSRNLVLVEMSARCPKTGFFAASLIQTQFFGVIMDH